MSSRPDIAPRLLTKEAICDYLGGISPTTYDKWHRQGLVPGPVPRTNRYDIKQHDHVLDKTLGLNHVTRKLSPLEQWELAHE